MSTDALDLSDEQLMAALAGGNDAALAALMSRWELPLRRFLNRILLNPADATELAQETFVRLYRHRTTFSDGSRFSPFLYAIASNLARNRLRWRSVRKLVPFQSSSPERAPLEFIDESAATGPDSAESQERIEAVRGAIRELPPDLRTVVVMFEYEGLPQRDIAGALGCSVKAVETRLYRARGLLRQKLEKWLA
jgi:RNA polymerase sigma-70 factor (ECF subfamily)